MKALFKVGDRKTYLKRVSEADFAAFHGEVVHKVCSTFALARDFEWTSRLFFLEMKDQDEEGVGTHLSIDHLGPAFVGEDIIFTATIEDIKGMKLRCRVEAAVNGRLVAKGVSEQKMIKKERLKELFSGKRSEGI